MYNTNAACPKGLNYAPENASCIAFTITVKLREALARYRMCLNIGINRAIDGGKMYNIVEDLSTTDAKIFGLGMPGDGVDYLGNEKDGEENDGEEKDVPKDVLDDQKSVVESNEASHQPDWQEGTSSLSFWHYSACLFSSFAVERSIEREIRKKWNVESLPCDFYRFKQGNFFAGTSLSA